VTSFHKDMPIIAAIAQHPAARGVFERHGMTCCMCIGASSESIEAGAIMHRVDPDDVVRDLNLLVSSPC
jgi:hybrid cluster-associated redox disulfide protein